MTRRELRALRAAAEAAGEPIPDIMMSADGSVTLTSSIQVITAQQILEAQQDLAAQQTRDARQSSEADQPESPADTPADTTSETPVETTVDAESAATDSVETITVVPIEIEVAAPEEASDAAVTPEPSDLEPFDAQFRAVPNKSDGQNQADGQNGTDGSDVPENSDAASGLANDDAPEKFGESETTDHAAEPAEDHPVVAAADRGVEPAQDAVEVPFGHWSIQAALDDDGTADSVLSRDVGVTTGAITTHALVLPSSSGPGDQLLGSLDSTGEIMITGSIDLPRSFGSTGAHPVLFDHPGVDALIDEGDREDAASESAPVRAIRAVSSSSSTRGVIEAPAPRKSRAPLIVGIVSGSILLIAIGVLVAALAFNVF